MRSSWPGLALLLVAHLGMLLTFELARRPLLTLLWFALGLAGLIMASRSLCGSAGARAVVILVVAALLRLLLLPLPPTLSDDAWRYLWDGKVAIAGSNPYLLAPEAPALEPLRDDLWERLPHRQVATVYPPLAIGLFSIAARLPASFFALKGLLALADLATCGLLVLLAWRLGLPLERAAWYAWNPLATLEIAGMGHVDALGICAVVATVSLLLRPPRAMAAGVGAATAVLAKLVPLVAVPVWARASGRPWHFLAVVLALVALGLVPIAASVGGLPSGLLAFGVSWEFNGPIYEPLWRLLDVVELPAAVAAGLDRLKDWQGNHELWNRLYPHNYPQLLAKTILAVALIGGLWLAWRRSHPVPATALVFASLILCSATVYPWYVLWVLPWAALSRQLAWRTLAGLVPLSYLPQLTGIELFPWVYLAIWLPFLVLLVRWPGWSID